MPPRRPTLLDLAAAAGVSRTTASNAFNRPDQLSRAVRARVLEAADRIGYAGPNVLARALRRGRTGVVGVVVGESLFYALDDPSAVAVVRGVARAVEGHASGLLVLPRAGDDAERRIAEAAVDGVVVYAVEDGDPVLEALRARRVPLVTVDTAPVEGAPSVLVDDRAGARAAAEHVLALGHRRLGVVAMEATSDGYEGPLGPDRLAAATYRTTRERVLGVLEAAEAAGLDRGAVPVLERRNRARGGEEAARVLLDASAPPTAVIALSDRLAIGVLEGARSLGLGVPQDVSVVGFDDVPSAAASAPPLTTVRQDAVEKGALAARLLLDRMAGRPALGQTLASSVVVRESTGELDDFDR